MTEMQGDAIRCDACPVMCYVRPGLTGACDRYANIDGAIVRTDPHVLLQSAIEAGEEVVPFLGKAGMAIRCAMAIPLSPLSARARPIRTTSPPPSSSPRRSMASIW